MTLRSRVTELTLRLNELVGAEGTDAPASTDFQPVAETPAPSAVNQLYNGELGHSVNTWFEAVAAAGDKAKECAYWFSHDAPAAGQQLDESTSLTDLNLDGDANPATNKTLKEGTHSTYSGLFCDWDRAQGLARLNGTKSLDTPYPSNLAAPGLTEYLSCIIARRDSRIRIPAGFRLFAGVYDNTAGQRDWVKAASAFTLTASVRGVPGATTERRYKVFLYTDRGYTFISNEVVVAGAPADGQFSATVDVLLEWDLIPGVLEARVYRNDVVSGAFRHLENTSSNSYADNGTFLPETVAGYPAATDTVPKAYVATKQGELSSLAVDGVAASWDTLFLNIPIPRLYDQRVTTGKQWLRLGQNMALDREMADAVVGSGSVTLQSASAAFTSLDTGRSATVTDGAGHAHAVTLTYVDASHVTMSAPWPYPNASNCTLYVTGGGDHGLLIDKIHTSYTAGAAFAPNPQDARLDKGGQQPAAAPNGSTQGTVGGGGAVGAGGGGIACVEESEPVLVFEGERVRAIPYSDVRVGQSVFTGELRRSRVQKLIRGEGPLVRLRCRNGVSLVCSPTHRVITTRSDAEGRAVEQLRPGDSVMTVLAGRITQTRVAAIEGLGRSGRVGTFRLAPGHVYAAGRARRSFWRWLVGLWRRLLGLSAPPSGVLSHNIKREQQD